MFRNNIHQIYEFQFQIGTHKLNIQYTIEAIQISR